MTVKEYAEKHPDLVLYLTTPDGCLYIKGHDLIHAKNVTAYPGCCDYGMKVPAQDILRMSIINMNEKLKNEQGKPYTSLFAE